MKKNDFPHYEFFRRFHKLKTVPVYIIYGKEAYLKDKVLLKLIDKFTTKDTSDFDLITVFGDESNGVDVVESLESLPFLAKNRVILLRNFGQMNLSGRELIAEYLNNPLKTSVLIIVTDKIDKRSSANKKIADKAISINCRNPYNSMDIVKWMRSELQNRNISMETEAVNYFANCIEPNYMIAHNELEKLIIYVKNSGKIRLQDVKKTVGQNRVNKIFDLQNALGIRNLKKSFSILENIISNEKSGVFITTMLTRFFVLLWKINSLRSNNLSDSEIDSRYLKEIFYKFRKDYLKFADNYSVKETKQILSYLLKADIDLKSLNLNESIILEPLIFKICKVS